MVAQSLIGLAVLGVTPNGYGLPNVQKVSIFEGTYHHFAAQPSVLLSMEAGGVPAGIKVPIFKDSDFPFVTIVSDSGTGKGGGWQEAKADLEFVKVEFPVRVLRWRCRILVGVPLRTEAMGKISPNLAASMSSGITNMVTIGMDFDLPQGIFCETFHTGVKALFKATYPRLGSSVMKW